LTWGELTGGKLTGGELTGGELTGASRGEAWFDDVGGWAAARRDMEISIAIETIAAAAPRAATFARNAAGTAAAA